MPTVIPALTVAQILEDATLGTQGTDIFVGGPTARQELTKRAALFCLQTGGPPPVPNFRGPGGIQKSFYEHRVQVIIRGSIDGLEAGRTKAIAVRDALHLVTPLPTGYLKVSVDESSPIWFRYNKTNNPQWSVNAILWEQV